ncbi:MAG: hypothetical protein K0R90_1688 [Oscillospiraceae bacterium]|nr:hypothetical protein [Oscillospiraceae bacterium]
MNFYRFARAVCRIVMSLWYKVEVRGKENLPEKGGYIICCNHRTNFDPLFLGTKINPDLTFMAKSELFETPIFGHIIKWLGAFPVHRGKGDTTAINTAVESIKDGKVLAIFPEGNRSKDGQLQRFKSGAALVSSRTGADIVPACVYFKGELSFRKKVTVRFGSVIKNEELGISQGTPSELKYASNILRTNVEKLLLEEDV